MTRCDNKGAETMNFLGGIKRVGSVLLAGSLLLGAGCVAPMDPAYDEPQQPSAATPPPPVLPPRDGPELTVNTGGPVVLPAPSLPPEVAAPGMGGTYVVKKGDSLSKIARSYGLSTSQLADMNGISNPNKIVIGQKLIVPGSAASLSGSGASSRSAAPAASAGGSYVVQKGDVLSRIAVRHGTTVAAIKSANGLSSDKIVVGQKLAIPGRGAAPAPSAKAAKPSAPKASTPAPAAPAPVMPEPPAPVAAPVLESSPLPAAPALPEVSSAMPADAPADLSAEAPMEYTVLTGDTLDEIAKLFIVSKEEIIRLNNLSPDADLQPGQTIRIPPPEL